MGVKQDFYERVRDDAGVIAAVGTDDNSVAKVYEDQAPQGVDRDYIVIRRISRPGHANFASADAISNPVFQVSVVASTAARRNTISEAVRDALDGFRGTMGSTNVRGVHLVNEADEAIGPGDATQSPDWLTDMDFEVWHVETVPTFS